MDILYGILLTLAIFTIIVFIHELGHFLTARATGMKVEEFGIGIPPRARTLGTDTKGTEYTLNWLPIGGFVRILGEDPGGENSGKKGAFSSKKWWARSLVLLAGVGMNFLLAILLFTGLFSYGVSPLMPNFLTEKSYNSYFLPSMKEGLASGYVVHDGIVLTPLTGGTASRQGLLAGDIIIASNDEVPESIEKIIALIETKNEIKFTILRGTGTLGFTIMPENKKIQSYIGYKNLAIASGSILQLPIHHAFMAGVKETVAISHMTLDLLGTTLRKLILPKDEHERKEATEYVSGPIGMGSGFVSMVERGVNGEILILLIAFLSINLGVLNILPFPALDGGRFISTTIRSMVGLFTPRRKLLDTIEYTTHAFGMILLLSISLIIAFFDLYKLF